MKIYCKPFLDKTNNPINGKVVDIYKNTTPLKITKIDDIYETYYENELVYVEKKENYVYELVEKQRLKECVVEFDTSDESKRENKIINNRSNLEKLRSTYWTNKIGITLDSYNVKKNLKDKEIEQKCKNCELEQNILEEKEARATHSMALLDIAKKVLTLENGGE